MSSSPSSSKASVHTEGPAEADDDVVEEEMEEEDADEALEVIDDGVDWLLEVVKLDCEAVLGDVTVPEGEFEGELDGSLVSSDSFWTSSALAAASFKSES